MRTWQRTFSTSIVKFNVIPSGLHHNAITCSKLLDSSVNGESSIPVDEKVTVQGFVRSIRKMKRSVFAEISDGSTIRTIQAVMNPGQATNITRGSTVEICGTWRPCPPGLEQTHEFYTESVRYLGLADPETYPIQKKYHTVDFLRQYPHLRLRTPFNSLLSRFRSEAIFQLGQIFRTQPIGPFVQVQPPLITSSDCEGAGETFTIFPREDVTAPTTTNSESSTPEPKHYFRTLKYLTVSSQLHLEAYAAELGRVWTLSPTFRAEKSDTPRHLSEFYMLEVEINFMDDLHLLMDVTECLIRDLTKCLHGTQVGQEIILAKRSGEPGLENETDSELSISKSISHRWEVLMNTPKWPRVTYTEAIKLLKEAVSTKDAKFQYRPSWSQGLHFEHEKYLVEQIFGGTPVFVTNYPKTLKPFYMAPSSHDSMGIGNTVACFDLLLPVISEVAGGSLREHRLPELIRSMREHGLIKMTTAARDSLADGAHAELLSPSEKPSTSLPSISPNYPFLQPGEDIGHLQWYADLRRWGTAPHGGFGLGFDRFLSYLAGVSSLRDVVPFPRYFCRAEC